LTVVTDSLAACERVPAQVFTASVFEAAAARHGKHADWVRVVDRHRPSAVHDVTDTFKTVWACFVTEAVCLAAIKAGVSLYLAPRCALTPAVSIAAFEHNAFNFTWIPDSHKTPAMCERAVQTDHGRLLEKVPPEWMTASLCALAVQANPTALQSVPDQFKTLDLEALAVESHPGALAWVEPDRQLIVLGHLIDTGRDRSGRCRALRDQLVN
jgi:hypothetical protein